MKLEKEDFTKSVGSLKMVYGKNKNKFQERSLDLATKEILIILSNSSGENKV